MTYTMTLRNIFSRNPCGKPEDANNGWAKLLRGLGEDYDAPNLDRVVSVKQILDLNGTDDAYWSLRCVKGHDAEIRLLNCDNAEEVLPIFEAKFPDDQRPRRAIEVSRCYAHGEATGEELKAAKEEVGVAANAAAMVAAYWAAARAAALAAAEAAHWAVTAVEAAAAVDHDALREKQKERLLTLIGGDR